MTESTAMIFHEGGRHCAYGAAHPIAQPCVWQPEQPRQRPKAFFRRLPSDPTRDATNDAAEVAVRDLLAFIGEDPDREGLLETPHRVAKSLREMTQGYWADPTQVLGTTFDHGGYDSMVMCSGIDFVSLCEHHLLPFTGVAAVGYLPGEAGRVVGLSKLARLVLVFAQRLQIQERMTQEIAQTLSDVLGVEDVGVVVQAHHSCMSCRGVKLANATMTTSTMLGAFRERPETRAEFLALAGLT